MRIVVIGAGIFGASVAYHLSKSSAEVHLIDEVHEGKATLAGAGIVCPWTTKVDEPDFYALYLAAGKYYRRLIAELEAAGEKDVGYRQVGSLVIGADEEEMRDIERRILPRTEGDADAGEVRRIEGAALQALFPPLRGDLSAYFVPGGARVEARRVAAAMVRMAIRNGAQFTQGHVRLSTSAGKATAFLDEVPLDADVVVLTSGAWTNQLLRETGIKVGVQPQKGQIVHLRVAQETKTWPVLLPQGSHYMLAFDDNRVVIGATRETGSGFDYRVTAGGQKEVLDFGLHLAPGLKDAAIIETRIGFRPASDTARPMFGRIPGLEGLLMGNGLGASGLTLGPFSGKLVAQLALQEAPDFDVSPFPVTGA
ncbi:NAD(P)/FAD-dependent oxidoreductase [Rhizobium binxianense]